MTVVQVATCQFPVSADIRHNARHIARQLRAAARRGADVAHFPEGALSGYAGVDFDGFAGFDWELLRSATAELMDLARELGIWVVLGSAHQLSGDRKPHNSLYVIDAAGTLVDRYDKRFCSGPPDGSAGDLAHYSPGDHLSTWEINGIRCGALICYDYRFPELYREYRKLGVQLVFHSFHAGNVPPERVAAIESAIGPELRGVNRAPTLTFPGVTMHPSMTAAAASNHVWISCPNSSAAESLWPAFFVRADGVTTGRLRRNAPGVLISEVDTGADLYDSTAAWRDRAIAGVLHSGEVVDDVRSRDRTSL
ncbi:carbon-nitrogen hydrolase family protein [Saccharopolyspora hirsuta]|uniref:Carbon-nitrogen hydrolase family protein n=1 Tax=Saccharopolyspora hirsuta TaxID=1837 RepID=A0A5M7BZ31_SACHI|nr:carbon-nitrogen hydrolase family protein [Saccharopolyspora hirsuta]KAA5833487.1 carbon-nitrogen hydrolase family protein [Saccharopolyspora hirsuta]MBF6507828.1 carbon-nitrogen hydrolase family protein [Nocardia farcinica]